MNNNSIIVGLYFGHNASVALAINGKVIFALSEERINRIKNFTGFPTLAYQYLLRKYLNGNPGIIDKVVFPTSHNQEFEWFIDRNMFPEGKYFSYYRGLGVPDIPAQFKKKDKQYFYDTVGEDRARIETMNSDMALKERALNYYENKLMVSRDRFLFVDHHTIHAYSTCCFSSRVKNPYLVFTLDGSGDNMCATVGLVNDGKVENLSRVERYASPGRFYREVTAFLGMKPDEHEYKVMGLAANHSKEDLDKDLYQKFASVLWINDQGEFESSFPMEFLRYYLIEECVYYRFDYIAAAAQYLIEDRVVEWIEWWIKKIGIHRIALSGGVFMNVKLNQCINESKLVEDIIVVPSAGDESLIFGCCYYGSNSNDRIKFKVNDLYLGPDFSKNEIYEAVMKNCNSSGFQFHEPENLDLTIAKLLAKGEIVARFEGRSEWGARALGNRSILAHPGKMPLVRVLNKTIKQRDFWMPFAPSILDTDFDKYLITKKNFYSPYMMMTYDCTDAGQTDLIAAIHPGDLTTRPQFVTEETNPHYYKLIKNFKELTGIGGVLNTSFNLHGDPIVLSPEDAFHVLSNSNLQYLAIGSWLIKK